jgi:hypothetical protein
MFPEVNKLARFVGLLIAASSAALYAQSLHIRPTSAAPGEWAVIEITWQSSPQQQLVALQWDARFPAAQLEGDPMMRLTLDARSAGKSLNCRPGIETRETETVRCILSGGLQPIPDGVLAVLSLKIREKAQPGTVRIQIEHMMGVKRDLGAVTLDPAEALVTVHPK